MDSSSSYLSGAHSSSGEDDSDVEPTRMEIGSPTSADDPFSPLAGQTTAAKRSTTGNTNSKLSFTAPQITSPIAAATTSVATPPDPNKSINENVPLSNLSSQLSLHMELQDFAKQRKKSINLTIGANEHSLIPHMDGTSSGVASAPNTAAAIRRTHNIRSMSLSIAHNNGFGSQSLLSSQLAAIRAQTPLNQPAELVATRVRTNAESSVTTPTAIESPTSSLRAASKRTSIFATASNALPAIVEAADPLHEMGSLIKPTTLLSLATDEDDSIVNLTTDSTATSSLTSSAASSKRSSIASQSETTSGRVSFTSMSKPASSINIAASGELDESIVTPKSTPTTATVTQPLPKAPSRLTCLEPPTSSQSESEVETQIRMVSFLLNSLKANRSQFHQHCITNLREENESLRELIQKFQSRSNTTTSQTTTESTQLEATHASLKRLHQHATWNASLHRSLKEQKARTDELRRKLQPPPSNVQSSPTGASSSTSTSPNAASRSVGLASPGQSTAAGSSSSTPSSELRPNVTSSTRSAERPPANGTIQAQVQRFHITKINKIRKNTPRILEVDLTTRTMTICKKDKKGGSKNEIDDDFSNRDIVITAGGLISLELNAKNDLQLGLNFIISNSQAQSGTIQMHFQSSPNLLSPSLSSSPTSPLKSSSPPFLSSSTSSNLMSLGSPTPPPPSKDQKNKTAKNWKILFQTKDERERFYRLVQMALLSGRDGVTSSNSTLPTSLSRLTDPNSTSYPQPQPNGSIVMQTYTPKSPALTPTILSQVRLLPLLPLASSLHTSWCVNKQQNGWTYGLQHSNTKLTHPYLVAFHSLPLQRRDYNLKIVTATLATVLTLGFSIRRPTITDDSDVDSQSKSNSSAVPASAPACSPLSPNPVAPFSTVGTISPDLLGLVDSFAECSHDLWSEFKIGQGWRYGPIIQPDAKFHPDLVPYQLLPPTIQEKVRHQSYKLVETLSEFGYSILRSSTPTTSQPASGSLKRVS